MAIPTMCTALHIFQVHIKRIKMRHEYLKKSKIDEQTICCMISYTVIKHFMNSKI